MLKFLRNLKTRTWLIIVAAVALSERVLLYLFYRPVAYNDTASYRRLAEAILPMRSTTSVGLRHGWTSYDGTRMPGYPAFLALVGVDERVYAAIRDTYIQYRQARVTQTGAPGNAIWDAIPALQEASGLGFIPLSNLLLPKISIRLILEHPLLYLRGVLQGWLWFWKAPAYWSPAGKANLPVRGILSALIGLERGGMMAANLAFIFGSLTLICRACASHRVGAARKKIRQTLKMDAFLWFTISTLWLTSILQTLLDHGDNPRSLVPMQSLIVFLVLWWGIQIVRKLREGKGN